MRKYIYMCKFVLFEPVVKNPLGGSQTIPKHNAWHLLFHLFQDCATEGCYGSGGPSRIFTIL